MLRAIPRAHNPRRRSPIDVLVPGYALYHEAAEITDSRPDLTYSILDDVVSAPVLRQEGCCEFIRREGFRVRLNSRNLILRNEHRVVELSATIAQAACLVNDEVHAMLEFKRVAHR